MKNKIFTLWITNMFLLLSNCFGIVLKEREEMSIETLYIVVGFMILGGVTVGAGIIYG
jgi:hypothetical protein